MGVKTLSARGRAPVTEARSPGQPGPKPGSDSEARSKGKSDGLVQIGTTLRKRAEHQMASEQERKWRPIIYWYLSFRCNLACAHCSVSSSPWVDTSKDLNTEECLEVVRQMKDLNVRMAILTGGEVLIRPDILTILQALREAGIVAAVETNGLRIDKPFLELAKAMQDEGLLTVAISLDGGTAETHERLRGPRSFHRTVRGLRALAEAKVAFSVQCVINNANIETIPNLYELAEELYPYCTTVQWPVLNPLGRGVELVRDLGLKPENIHRMFETIKTYEETYSGVTRVKVPPAMIPPKYLSLVLKTEGMSCTTTCDFPLLGVLPDGNVSICALTRDQDDLQFGNIRDTSISLKKVWSETRMDMLRSKYLASTDLQGICGDCVWQYTCKGSCRAWAYEEGHSFDAPFPICQAMDEADAFPKAYRVSLQNAAVVDAYRRMNVSSGCA